MARDQPVRRTPKVRQHKQAVDPTTGLDLSNVDPIFELEGPGAQLWEAIRADPPYWWEPADVAMAMTLCRLTDALADALEPGDKKWTARTNMFREWRAMASELGMSPIGRGRLQLTVSQAAAAAARQKSAAADAAGKPKGDPTYTIDMDDLAVESDG